MMTTSFWMNTSLTHDYAYDQFRWSQLVRAIGQPFIITPLAVTTYEGIAKMDLGSASGLFNMLRNLGGSIGISMLSTVLTWRYRLHFNRLGEHVTLLSQPVAQRLSTLAAGFVSKGAAGPVAQGQAIQALGGALNREANIMAFIDCFWLMAVSLGLAGLGLFMMRKPRQVSSSAVGH